MTYHEPNRHKAAKHTRNKATKLSTSMPHPVHRPNNDPKEPFLFNFTKGLSHGENGLLKNEQDYRDFAKGTQTHDPNVFAAVSPHRGPFLNVDPNAHAALDCEADRSPYRQWESPTAGHAFVFEGPDPGAMTMPPAPEAGSAEFAAEIAEVYQMALGREWGVASLMSTELVGALTTLGGKKLSAAAAKRITSCNAKAKDAADTLSHLRWFKGRDALNDTADADQRARRRFGKKQTPSNMFRGEGEDNWNTPFLSQLMFMGSGGCTRDLKKRASGTIAYGAQSIDQKVRVAKPETDYMMKWAEYIDVQNGANVRPLASEFIPGARRKMSSLRDMATYVHDDQLYQAYLNAALILLDEKFAFDSGIPFHGASANALSRNNREPFALFGGPHLLTLVTEVSSRALKAVRLQKFTVHRRLRPEAAAALFHTVFTEYHPHRDLPGTSPYDATGTSAESLARHQMASLIAPYTHPYASDGTSQGSDPALDKILTEVRLHNEKNCGDTTWLLPMAFPEGSPMHPAYGAGHATVAGACVTLLKAFFNMSDYKNPKSPTYLVKPKGQALVPDCGASPEDVTIDALALPMEKGLTLEGELNKLIWNISNARNIGGVHFYTDYIESALLGEAITIGILREQMMAYHAEENVEMTVPLLVERRLPDALLTGADPSAMGKVKAVKIRSDGTLTAADPTPGR
ncbi:hypothetical protein [Ascidiaceihabitans sp.]|uniref:hypothetical protein n=1 Tax=Ascidiaceihabitans sp. TaxID=1872644 RepID=UPI003296BD4F